MSTIDVSININFVIQHKKKVVKTKQKLCLQAPRVIKSHNSFIIKKFIYELLTILDAAQNVINAADIMIIIL